MNDFKEQLAQSHAAEDLPLWLDIYNQSFPGFAHMQNHREDGEHQRAGIDRSILMPNGKQWWIDEKIRGRNKITRRVYRDIILEYVSNDVRNTPGWVCKPLLCDYIAYAIAPLGRAYLLPVPQLQAAWLNFSDYWLSKFRNIEAQNNGYKTLSVCLPVNELFSRIGGMLRPKFDPTELEEP